MEITVKELNERLQAGQDVFLLDVREPFEREIVNRLHATLPGGFDARRMLQSKGGGGFPDVTERPKVARFSLLLPDDSAALPVRTRALSDWCGGFLYGLALGGIREDADLPETVREVMRDFYEISHAGFVTDAPDEGDETAYVEIVEYVRISVLLLLYVPPPALAKLPLKVQLISVGVLA